MSGDATILPDGTVTVNSGSANAVIQSAKVNEAGGVLKGQLVYISGATGGFPQVSLADNTIFQEADVLAIANEAGTDGQTILITTNGLIEGLNTNSFLEGDILYLGTAGGITNVHPTGINAVQRIGHAVKINVATGSILLELDMLTIISDYNGTMRHQIVNGSTGIFASAGYTMVNDVGHRASINYRSSNFGTLGNVEVMGFYNEGYGKTIFTVDGNHPFEWNTDVTDAHAFAATPKMVLSAVGDLSLVGALSVGGAQFEKIEIISTNTLTDLNSHNFSITASPVVTLHDATTATGQVMMFNNKGVGIVSFTGTIQGDAAFTLNADEVINIISDGAVWILKA